MIELLLTANSPTIQALLSIGNKNIFAFNKSLQKYDSKHSETNKLLS